MALYLSQGGWAGLSGETTFTVGPNEGGCLVKLWGRGLSADGQHVQRPWGGSELGESDSREANGTGVGRVRGKVGRALEARERFDGKLFLGINQGLDLPPDSFCPVAE